MATKSTASNSNLRKANKAKKDEFYTQLVDIEKELKHYKEQLKGKVIYCNCDDPFESNFFKYFILNFKHLGLKKLITTSFKPSPIANTELVLQPTLFGDDPKILSKKEEIKGRPKVTANKFIITDVGDVNGDGAYDIKDVAEQLKKNKNNEWSPLESGGDFRSLECIELLKESDVVVTNPPFSLFREYVAQLVEYDKKFLIIGNMNAITYKEIFKLIKDNILWLGYNNGPKIYQVPDNYDQKTFFIGEDNKRYAKMGNTCWYTNLDVKKRHEELILYKKYTPKEYPKYDNYDAINIDKTADIPMDYDGVMGVPITFLDKHNPEQFEIIWIADRQNSEGLRTKTYTAEDATNYNDLNRGPVIKMNGELKVVYMRILIKKKK